MGFLALIILVCIPVFVFLYNLIAAIGHNVRQAIRSDEPYQVVAIGNIMAASGALATFLILFFTGN